MSRQDSSLPNADAELKELVAAMCDGVISPDQHARLQARLAAEPQALAYYVAYLDLHAQLQWRCRGEEKTNLAQIPQERKPTLGRLRDMVLRPTPFSLTTAALVMGLLLTGLAVISPPIYRSVTRSGFAADVVTVAEVSRTSAAVWDPPRDDQEGTRLLVAGEEIQLVSGLAEVQIYRGVRLTLEGPARLRIAGDNAVSLDRGKLVAKVADTAHGFEVRTPVAKARDLGTEFAIAVAENGATDLHVFQGKVEMTPSTSARDDRAATYLLVAGQRLQVSASGVATRSASGNAGVMFVRRLPPQTNELRITDEYVQAVRAAAPAIYWRFEKATDGRIASEMSPDHPLDVVGGVRLLPSDENNHSAVFGGARDKHYLIGRNVDMLAGPQYSVELWCQPYTQSRSTMAMLGLARGTVTDSLMLSLEGQGQSGAAVGSVRYLHRSPPGGGGGSNLFSGGGLAVGQWHHIVAVYDGGAMQLYVNGNLTESTAAAQLVDDAQVIVLGRLGRDDAQSRALVGRLDEVAIYDRAVSAAEVREHYELAKRAP